MLNKKYRKMIEQIKLDNEAYTDEEMKPVYKAQQQELDTLEVLLGALFVKYAIDGLLKMNSRGKDSMSLKLVLIDMGKRLGNAEVEKVTSVLSAVYEDTYYKNAFIQDSGISMDLKFDMLKQKYIDAAVNAKYKGELFSDRIWANKADMIDKLQTGLIKTMNGKTTIDKIAKDIKDTFNVTAYESRRLVNTEMARCQSIASVDIAKSIGIDKHIWSATLDMRTNPKDASYDGRAFNVDDTSEPQIPLHPDCRCCWVDEAYPGWQPTSRRDNETKDVIDYVNYGEWKANKGI